MGGSSDGTRRPDKVFFNWVAGDENELRGFGVDEIMRRISELQRTIW